MKRSQCVDSRQIMLQNHDHRHSKSQRDIYLHMVDLEAQIPLVDFLILSNS